MGNVNINHDEKVLQILKKRLRQRELQAATYGISADPVINIEIEDLKKEIRSLNWEIARLSEYRAGVSSIYISRIPTSTSESQDDSNVQYNLSGKWKLQEDYEFGHTTGDIRMEQQGNHLSGIMTIHDMMDDGEEIILQENFSGMIRETTVFLYGESISAIGNSAADYELDQWIGLIKNNDTIEGNSIDIDETAGKFVMKRSS